MQLVSSIIVLLLGISWSTQTKAEPKLKSTEATTKPLTILAVGDSLTEGYQVPESASYPALLELKLQEKLKRPVKVINGGVSGATTASGLRRLNWHLKGKHKPSVLILALGANDGLRGLSLEHSEKNLSEIIMKAKSLNLKVILAGMQIPPNYGKDYAKRFADLFPRLAKKHQVHLIPFLLEGVAAKPKLNLPDGIHPNIAGYEIIANTVLAHVESLL